MAAAKTPARDILDKQADLHAELSKVSELELLTELKRLADQPVVREFVRHAMRIVEVAPPSTIANQVVGLNNIMQGIDANLEMRFAQLAAEAHQAAEAEKK